MVNNAISNVMVHDDVRSHFWEPITGDDGTTAGSYAASNYQKPFTDPLFTEGEKGAFVNGDQVSTGVGKQTGKMADNESRFNDYGQSQAEIFKTNNPVHRYSRGKNSPFYGRQQGRQQRLNAKARQLGEEKTTELSGRYEKRISKEYGKNISKADYGILAGFVVADLISQYERKSFAKYGMTNEQKAQANINIIANEH